MVKNKRFILKIPYFLATKAGSWWIKMLLASCYFILALGFVVPFAGSIIASIYSLIIWQFINIKTKYVNTYKIYFSFLLQRLILCNIFTIGIYVYCNSFIEFNYGLWKICSIFICTLLVSDVYFTLKGFIGVAYINAKKDNN